MADFTNVEAVLQRKVRAQAEVRNARAAVANAREREQAAEKELMDADRAIQKAIADRLTAIAIESANG